MEFQSALHKCENNRAYLATIPVDVPWDNKDLIITKETFRDKLAPGEHEMVTLKIKGKKDPIAAAEMAATMYDYSLDQFEPHSWSFSNIFKRSIVGRHGSFINSAQSYHGWASSGNDLFWYPKIEYTHFPSFIELDNFRYEFATISNLDMSTADVAQGKNKEFEGAYGIFRGIILGRRNR